MKANFTGVISSQAKGKNRNYITFMDFEGDQPIKVGLSVDVAEKDMRQPVQIELGGLAVHAGESGMYFTAETFKAEKLKA